MPVLFEEQFQVDAPIELAWAYLSDPVRVAPCLPGAELTEVLDGQTYKGQVRVQVGPILAQYQGTATIAAQDAAAHTATLVARATQIGANGRAEGRMTYQLRALAPRLTEVQVQAEVNVTGRLAQLGGGAIQSVARQLFQEFVRAAQQEILAGEPTPAPAQELVERAAPGGARPEAAPAPAMPARPLNATAFAGRVLLRFLLERSSRMLRALLYGIDALIERV